MNAAAQTTGPAPTPVRLTTGFDAEALRSLIQTAFAYMEGRIDPPSSINRLDAPTIRAQAMGGEIWAVMLGTRPIACAFFTPMPDSLYIGKLAVAAEHRGEGLARALVEQAARRAAALGFTRLVTQSRVELIESQQALMAMGFRRIGTTAHPGYDRPTSVTLDMSVGTGTRSVGRPGGGLADRHPGGDAS